MLNSKYLTLLAATLSIAVTLGMDVATYEVIVAFVAAVLVLRE